MMMRMRWVAAVVMLVCAAAAARAEEVFYKVALSDLKLTGGALPQKEGEQREIVSWERERAMTPFVVLDGPGEAYISGLSTERRPRFGHSEAEIREDGPDGQAAKEVRTLHVRAPKGKDVSGRLFVAKPDGSKMVEVKFTIAAAMARENAREWFYDAKAEHYHRLRQAGMPGTAWFRHQELEARAELGEKAQVDAGEIERREEGGETPHDQMSDSFSLFSGGKAISENLQLDRELGTTRPSGAGVEATIDVDSIDGIDAKPMDWKTAIEGKKPATDPLAGLIPADQYAIFFPSFDAAVAVMDEADVLATPAAMEIDGRFEDARTKEKYQKQLGLKLTGLGKLLGPALINGMALTGSDLYWRVGSDVAVLFEAKDAASLHDLILMQVKLSSRESTDAKSAKGQIGEVAYDAMTTADRSICSYVATINNAVVVTNSLEQLKRIAAAHKGDTPAMNAAPEYIFFRDRYTRGAGEESALAVLTDAAIRRWCGPRWRIADSRRTRVAADMAEAQAAGIDKMQAKGNQEIGTQFDADARRLATMAGSYGTLQFMTPIVEMDVQKVTPEEKTAYIRWRDGYERQWKLFDPIAVRMSVKDRKLAMDLTVMPLILGSDYRQFLDIVKGAKIAAGAADPHDALGHLVISLNKDAQTLKMGAGLFGGMAHVDPLSWLGQSVAIYCDNDPLWEELAKAEDPKKFMEKNVRRLPVALRLEVGDRLKLAAFLTAIHGFVDQSAPGMTVWETIKYKEQAYVKISASADAAASMPEEMRGTAAYYAAVGDGLVVTINEEVLKRAIDRQLARAAGGKVEKMNGAEAAGEAGGAGAATTFPSTMPATRPWLGENMALQVKTSLIMLIAGSSKKEMEANMQAIAWENIFILNEWKRMFPEMDPHKVHETLWGSRLVDQVGGSYVWNEKLATMESENYGCPAAPRDGPLMLAGYGRWQFLNCGITFDGEGLRGRAEVEREGSGGK